MFSMYFRPFTTCTRALLTRDSLNKKMSFVELLNFSTLCLAALSTSESLVFIVLGNPGFTLMFKSLQQKSEEYALWESEVRQQRASRMAGHMVDWVNGSIWWPRLTG